MDLTELMPALEGVVFERLPDRRFLARTGLPAWCDVIRPDTRWTSPLALEEVFPFLTVFLPEAERLWTSEVPLRLVSDIWADVHDIHLRAVAVRVREAHALIISRTEQAFEEKQTLLQRARELRIVHSSLMRELEQKDVLVHAIVHDLAAPLHTILGVLSLFGEQPRRETEASWLRIALQAAERQRELIGEILDVLTADEGAREGESGGVELTGLIDRVIAERDPVARTRSLRIERGGPLPPTYVVGDSMRLFRVLTNLVDNALRLSPPDGVVRVLTRRDGNAVTVLVEDEGPGVAPDVLPRLFEKFARARDSFGGTGLGLFFCRITVENWGGGIGYEPREPRGARFWVRLPILPSGRAASSRERKRDDGEVAHAR